MQLTAEEQQRRAALQQKLEDGTLTTEEHQELIQLNDWAEWLNVQRLEALLKAGRPLDAAIEDVGLADAIREGRQDEFVSEEEIRRIISSE